MKVAAVILNYNDAEETIAAVRRIAAFACLDTVIVVDNASTDGSAERLKAWLSAENRRLLSEEETEETDDAPEDEPEQFHRYMLVRAERNGGYGYGNNLGVQYAYENAGAELVLIANPDAAFSEKCAEAMIACFENDPTAAVVSVPVQGADGTPDWQGSAWPLHGFYAALLETGPLTRRLFRKRLRYPDAMFAGAVPLPVRVDAVHGALLMVDADRFMACGGYDEEMFLYNEENVLAWKMKENGSETLLLTDQSYCHKGSATISASYDAVERQKLRQRSEFYFYRKYLEISPLQSLLARCFQALVLLETRIFLGRK